MLTATACQAGIGPELLALPAPVPVLLVPAVLLAAVLLAAASWTTGAGSGDAA
jgi:hypothetical protein